MLTRNFYTSFPRNPTRILDFFGILPPHQEGPHLSAHSLVDTTQTFNINPQSYHSHIFNEISTLLHSFFITVLPCLHPQNAALRARFPDDFTQNPLVPTNFFSNWRALQQHTVFVSNLSSYLIKLLQLFPACFIYTLFVTLSLFVAQSKFCCLIELLTFYHPLLSIHYLRYLPTL